MRERAKFELESRKFGDAGRNPKVCDLIVRWCDQRLGGSNVSVSRQADGHHDATHCAIAGADAGDRTRAVIAVAIIVAVTLVPLPRIVLTRALAFVSLPSVPRTFVVLVLPPIATAIVVVSIVILATASPRVAATALLATSIIVVVVVAAMATVILIETLA